MGIYYVGVWIMTEGGWVGRGHGGGEEHWVSTYYVYIWIVGWEGGLKDIQYIIVDTL